MTLSSKLDTALSLTILRDLYKSGMLNNQGLYKLVPEKDNTKSLKKSLAKIT